MSASRWLAATVLFLSAWTRSAGAQVVSAGPEFQVNTYTNNNQAEQSVCTTEDGGFVVAWSREDGDADGVFGKRYASNGDELGTEFQVNTYTTGEQFQPSVCCGAAGNFAVVWSSAAQDGEALGVFARRFASSGASLGTEFQVNTYTVEAQYGARVCCDAAGDFVVAWISYEQDDGSYHGIFAQRFASDGSFRGTEFQVNTYTIDSQFQPSLCCDAVGDFVVAWESELQDGELDGVFAQRFASGGSAQGTEFQVNTYTVGDNEDPAACCDATGSFVVTWESFDGSGTGVIGQRFGSDGGALGGEFLVNTYTTQIQSNPSVCCDREGSFVVAWNSANQVPGGGNDIFAQRFSDDGSAAGGEFQVNVYSREDQDYPAAACGPNAAFVVVWQSIRQDGSDEGIFGRRFASLLPTPTPVLSWLGLGAVVAGLAWAGTTTLRRRRRAPR